MTYRITAAAVFATGVAINPVYAASSENVRVIDGDTIEVRIRLANVDAPEVHGACDAERRLAAAASEFVAAAMAGAKQLAIVVNPGRPFDRYGRVLATVTVDGADLGEALVAAGLAHVWRGSRAKSGSWCE